MLPFTFHGLASRRGAGFYLSMAASYLGAEAAAREVGSGERKPLAPWRPAGFPESVVFRVERTFVVTLGRPPEGLGLTVNLGDCRVVRVVRGGAAERAGVRKFDRVTELNGRALTGGNLGAAIAAERAENLELTLERPPKSELTKIGAHEAARTRAVAAATRGTARGGARGVAAGSAGSGGGVSQLRQTALRLKRIVEAAVLRAHPEWGGSRVGDEVQAFSDFLFYVLDSPTLIAELAIAIFDSESGFVEIFKGARYQAHADDDAKRAHLLTIRYVPGHYQALVGPSRPTLEELCAALDAFGVFYVVTDG
jgi:hypothetical protein